MHRVYVRPMMWSDGVSLMYTDTVEGSYEETMVQLQLDASTHSNSRHRTTIKQGHKRDDIGEERTWSNDLQPRRKNIKQSSGTLCRMSLQVPTMIWMCMLLLLSSVLSSYTLAYSSAPADPSISPDPRTTLRIGIVVPFIDGTGVSRAAAPLIAARHVNNRSGEILPFLATLNPNLRIETVLADTSYGLSALTSPSDLLFASHVSAVVGDSSSSRCFSEAFVLGLYGVPQISHSCTSARLSDKDTYSTFFRLVPPDDKQGLLLAKFVIAMKWRRVAVLAQVDPYAQGIVTAFTQAYVGTGGGSITATFAFPTVASQTNQADLDTMLQGLIQTGARIVLLVAFAPRAFDIFARANLLGLLDETYVWIGAEGTMGAKNAPYGLVGSLPYNGFLTQGYANLKSAWTGYSMSSYPQLPGIAPNLFATWPDGFVPQSYDSLIAFAVAASKLLDEGLNITSSGLLTKLKDPTFTFLGVSGQVRWDAHQDSTANYVLANWQQVNVTGTSLPSNVTKQVALALVDPSASGTDVIPSSVFTDIKFRSGTNEIPADILANFELTILLSGRQLGHAVPIDDLLIDCVRNGSDPLHSPFITVNQKSTQALTSPCYGGFARRASYIKQRRQETNASIVIDIGDSFFGTPLRELDNGLTMATFFDATGYDLYGIGVSDFFLGPLAFGTFISSLQKPCIQGSLVGSGMCVVASNLDISSEQALQYGQPPSPRIVRWCVRTMADPSRRQVGFLALVYSEFGGLTRMGGTKVGIHSTLPTGTEPSGSLTPAQAVQILDLQTALKEMQQAYPQVNIIILIADGNGEFIDLLPSIPEIDCVLMAYSILPSKLISADGGKGLIYTVANAPKVPLFNVEKAWRFSDITLEFDIRGELLPETFFANRTDLLSDVPEDPLVSTLVANATSKVAVLFSTVIATIPSTVDGGRGTAKITNDTVVVTVDGCRVSDCPMGLLITDAILSDCPDCSFAHINVGAVRTSLTYKAGGAVTRSDVLVVLPFGNIVNYYTLIGSDVLLLLNALVREFNTGSWPTFSGLRFAYSAVKATAAQDLKVVYVEIRNPTTKVWELVRPDSYYKIATNDFVPLNEPIILNRALNVVKFGRVVADVVIDFLKSPSSASKIIPRNETSACASQVLSLPFDVASKISGKLLWPPDHSACRIIQANQVSFLPCGINEVRPPGLDALGFPLDCVCREGYIRDTSNNNHQCVLIPCGANEARVIDLRTATGTRCSCIPGFTRQGTSEDGDGICSPCPRNMFKKLTGDHTCQCSSGYYNISALSYGLFKRSSVSSSASDSTSLNGGSGDKVPATFLASGAVSEAGEYELDLLSCLDLSGLVKYSSPVNVPVVLGGPGSNSSFLWQVIPQDSMCQPCPSACMKCEGDKEQPYNASASADTTASETKLGRAVSNVTVVDASTFTPSFVPLRTFWWSGRSSVIYSCPFQSGSSCIGGSVSVTASTTSRSDLVQDPACLDGYAGLICSVCLPGYGSFDGIGCAKCAKEWQSRLFMSLVLLAIVLFIALTIRNAFSSRSLVGVTTKIFANWLHVSMYVARFRLSDSDVISTMAGLFGFSSIGGSQTLSYNCAVDMDALDKSLIITCLVGLIFLVAICNIVWSRACRSQASKQASVANLTLQRFGGGGGPGAQNGSGGQSSSSSTVKPIAGAGSAAGRTVSPSVAANLRSRRVSYIAPTIESVQTRTKVRIFPVCIIVLFMIYPAVVQESLSVLRPCWNINGSQYMVEDLRIDCASERYKMWIIISYVKLAIVGCGFPLAILFILYRKEHRDMLYEPRFFERFRFLFEGYKRGYGYWESFILLRQLCIVIIAVQLSEQPILQAFLAGLILLLACALHVACLPFDNPFTNRLETSSLFTSMIMLSLLGMASATQKQESLDESATRTATLSADGLTTIEGGDDASATTTGTVVVTSYRWSDPVIWILILAVAVNVIFALAVAKVVFPSWFRKVMKWVGIKSASAQGGDEAGSGSKPSDADADKSAALTPSPTALETKSSSATAAAGFVSPSTNKNVQDDPADKDAVHVFDRPPTIAAKHPSYPSSNNENGTTTASNGNGNGNGYSTRSAGSSIDADPISPTLDAQNAHHLATPSVFVDAESSFSHRSSESDDHDFDAIITAASVDDIISPKRDVHFSLDSDHQPPQTTARIARVAITEENRQASSFRLIYANPNPAARRPKARATPIIVDPHQLQDPQI